MVLQSSLSWRSEAFSIIKLALPLAMTQLAFLAMVSTDILMMGWLGVNSLAAATLAGHYFWMIQFFSMGLLSSIAPIISKHLATRNNASVHSTVRQGFWAGILIMVPCVIAAWWSGSIFVLLGQEVEISMTGQTYIRAMLFGLLPGLWHVVLSENLLAHQRPRAALVIAICAIAVNAQLNYIFIFGKFGFPALGLVGAGVSTSIVAALMFLSMLVFVKWDKEMRKYKLLKDFLQPDWPRLFEIFRVGVPIALTEMSEIATLFFAALLMGLISVDALAAHGIAVQCIELALMVPIGFMQAASIRVARADGENNLSAARHAGHVALSLNLLYTFIPMTFFILFSNEIVALFLDTSNSQNVKSTAIATSILAMASLFLFVDSMHLVARGTLIGLKDTKIPMYFSFAAYGVGLPLAWYLAIYQGLGPSTVWVALSFPLLALFIALIWRFNRQIRTGLSLPHKQ